jgi:hypothetical protein
MENISTYRQRTAHTSPTDGGPQGIWAAPMVPHDSGRLQHHTSGGTPVNRHSTDRGCHHYATTYVTEPTTTARSIHHVHGWRMGIWRKWYGCQRYIELHREIFRSLLLRRIDSRNLVFKRLILDIVIVVYLK